MNSPHLQPTTSTTPASATLQRMQSTTLDYDIATSQPLHGGDNVEYITLPDVHPPARSSFRDRGGIRKRAASSTRAIVPTQHNAERLYQAAVDQSEQQANFTLTSSIVPPYQQQQQQEQFQQVQQQQSQPPHHSQQQAQQHQWITPRPSPQRSIFPDPSTTFIGSGVLPSQQWTVPTPPRSDSGVPTVSVDANEESLTSDSVLYAGNSDFNLAGQQQQASAGADMSSLGFLLPSQYGSTVLESEPTSYTMDPIYGVSSRMSQSVSSSGGPNAVYAHVPSSSPALYQSRAMAVSSGVAPSSSDVAAAARRQSGLPSTSGMDPPYNIGYRRISHPYENPMPTGDFPMASNQTTIPSITGLTQSALPSPHAGSTAGHTASTPHYTSGSMASRSPTLYDSEMYAQQGFPPAGASSSIPSYSSQQTQVQPRQHPGALQPQQPPPLPQQISSYPPPFIGSSVNELLAKPSGSDDLSSSTSGGNNSAIRVLERPKPQCWEHGCDGRQFSTFSNLLRHQREKSGAAAKSYCPRCGAEFTRTTARNGHMAHNKCAKQTKGQGDS